MPAIYPLFPRRLQIDWRSSAKAFHRSAAVALMLAICAVAATEPANAQSQTIDLSRQPVGAPPQDFEFWRADEADIGHWVVAGVDADVTQNHWQLLEVVVDGSSFKMSLDDRWALTAFDYGKPVGGHSGIWTERDDVIRFNQIEITPLTDVSDDENLRSRAGGESRTE